jgi:hypothetical protein
VIVQDLVDDYREATEALGYHQDMVAELQARRAAAVEAMHRKFRMSFEQISERTGLAETQIRRLLAILPPGP